MSDPENNAEAADRIFTLLLESGAIELTGLDQNGEPTYRITAKCSEVFPEFFEFHHQMMNTTANELWQMGVIEMEFTMRGESVVFNSKNYERLKEVYRNLTEEQVLFLEAMGAPIKRLY